jgi:hypothetical protein
LIFSGSDLIWEDQDREKNAGSASIGADSNKSSGEGKKEGKKAGNQVMAAENKDPKGAGGSSASPANDEENDYATDDENDEDDNSPDDTNAKDNNADGTGILRSKRKVKVSKSIKLGSMDLARSPDKIEIQRANDWGKSERKGENILKRTIGGKVSC